MMIEGLDTSKPAEYVSDSMTPSCQNMTVERSVLKKREGTTVMGGVLGGVTPEYVMAGQQLLRIGVRYNVRIGTAHVEKWNNTTSAWDDITGTALTATNNDAISIATPLLSGNRILVFTNNVDAMRKYNGTGNVALLGGTPPIPKFIVEFGAYLVCAYVTSGGNTYPCRVQWCHTGDPETWSGGNAGSKDLTEDGGDITGIANFGNFVSVHKDSSIYLGYLVSSSSIFKFDRKNVEGTICNNTIKMLPTGDQIYLASSGLRLFNGISAPLIESPVTDDLREGVNPSYVHRSWSVLVPEKDEVWIGVPLGSQTTADSIFKYNYRTKACHKDTRSNITSAWLYNQSSGVTWDDLSGTTWDAMPGRWNDNSLLALFPVVALGDSSGYVYRRNTVVNNDNLVAIDGQWTTKDWQSEELGRLCQWVAMDLWAKGDNVVVDYSTDEGATWLNIGTYSLTSTYPADDDPLEIWFDVVSSKIRFRFRNLVSGETFYIKQYTVGRRNREMRG